MKRWLIGLVAVAVILNFGMTCLAADFNGDGTEDIAVFRSNTGLWSVRRVTRVYFGTAGDVPVPGDYSGNGTDRPAIFRPGSGLWIARGVTRVYFGAGDQAQPGDYNGDGKYDVGIFRSSSGLWAAKGVTRVYFGGAGDTALMRPSDGGGLLKTGQTTSYRSGDDGAYEKGAAFSYQTLNPAGNGQIVTIDNVTGLMWAADGNGKGCNWGNQTTWDKAIDWAEGLTFAGYSDWRLPNIRELHSLVNFGHAEPAIDTAYFPNTYVSNYWSGTTYASGTGDISWYVYFYGGFVGTYPKTGSYYVRAVRGGK